MSFVAVNRKKSITFASNQGVSVSQHLKKHAVIPFQNVEITKK